MLALYFLIVVKFMFNFIRSFTIIFACLYLGKAFIYITNIPISASIIGMLILFFLLAFQIIPVIWIQSGCQLFIKHMALLFVPVGVGLMEHFDLLRNQACSILLSTFASSCVVFIIVGILTEYLMEKQK